jgi:hypothetical protein
MKDPAMPKNVVELTESDNPRQRLLEYKSNTFDSNIQVRIIYDGIINAPTTEQTLENLKPVLEATQQSIEDITIVVSKSAYF